jgi:hypothetical protein
MRVIKVLIVLIAICAIALYVKNSYIKTVAVQNVRSGNSEVEKKIDEIEAFIKELSQKPDSEFCKESFNLISYYIEEAHKERRLGVSTVENDQWRENLSRQLYAAYTDKFIKQAFYVFNGSGWNEGDIKFIREEHALLQSSPNLQRNSPIDVSFNEIRAILNKYDEILTFINYCKSFKLEVMAPEDTFPIEDVKIRMARAQSYLTNNLENTYVKNCEPLKAELKSVPDIFYIAHYDYLNNKVKHWSGTYNQVVSQKAYNENIWIPLKYEIEILVSGLYKTPEVNKDYDSLKAMWEEQGLEAYKYWNMN